MAEVFENLMTRGEGPLFWLSLTAIALGVALIVGAASWRLRAIFVPKPVVDTPAAAVAPQFARAEGVAAYGAGTTPDVAANPGISAEIAADLVARLQAAADSLETMTRDFAIEDENTLESPLKPTDDDVEYVFKASTL